MKKDGMGLTDWLTDRPTDRQNRVCKSFSLALPSGVDETVG
jgi:hypothetical protein